MILFLCSACTFLQQNENAEVREIVLPSDTEETTNKEQHQSHYLERVQSVLPEAKDFTDDNLTVTQIDDTEYFLISSTGCGGSNYCLYNELTDKIVLFDIHSTKYPMFEGDFFKNGGSEGTPMLIGTLQDKDVYFTDATHTELAMLASGQKFWTHPWDFPTTIKYNVIKDSFRVEKIKLNVDYTTIPGIESPYLYLGYNSLNRTEMSSYYDKNSITIDFDVVEENNNDDKSPAIYYYFDTKTSKASLLFINSRLKENATIKNDFDSVKGISDTVISTIELKNVEKGFLDFIQEKHPNELTLDFFYQEKAEVQCILIGFSVNQNVNLYGQMIVRTYMQPDTCSLQFHTQ